MLEFMGFLCLTGGIAARALRSGGRGWFALTAYCAACSFCVFYPPIWAPMLWVVCGAVADVAWRRQRLGAGTLLIALIAVGGLVGVFYHLPYLSLVAGTAYPGRRILRAGEMPLDRLIEMVWPSLTVSAPVHCGPERYVGIPPSNVCEASSLEVLPLAVLPALALVSGRVRRAFGALVRTSPASVLSSAARSSRRASFLSAAWSGASPGRLNAATAASYLFAASKAKPAVTALPGLPAAAGVRNRPSGIALSAANGADSGRAASSLRR